MKRIQAMCLAAMTALAGAAITGSASAAVFDEVPSDAMVVFEVKNIDQFNTKWNKFADATGLTQAAPNIKDPVAALEARAGITKGINTGGDLAMAMFQTGDEKPKAVTLVSVTDYKAFVGNFTNAQEGADGITQVTDKDGDTHCIAHWGDYAALADVSDKAVLAQKPQGIKLAGIAADAVASKDAVLWVNMDQVRSEELPKLKKNRDAIIQRISERAPSPNPLMKKVGWDMIFDQVEEIMQDTKDSVFTLDLGDDGVALNNVADFLPDTPYAKIAATMKGTDQPMLTGLPDKKYLLLIGQMMSPELKQQIATTIIDPLTKKLDTGDAANKPALAALAATKARMAATTGGAMGMVKSAGNPGQEALDQLVAAMTGDGPAWEKASVAGFQAVADMSKNADPAAPVTMSLEIKPDAATVQDVHLDQISIKTDFNGNDPRAMQARQMQAMMFGPSGITGYIGAPTDKTGIFTMDIDSQSATLADLIAAAKSGKDVLSSAKVIQDVSAKLPSPRVAEGFIFVDQMLDLGVHVAQGFGLGIHINIPADVDPIGIAISGNGTTVQSDAFIPVSLVKAVVGVVNDLHGGGGGGAGPGQPAPGGQGL